MEIDDLAKELLKLRETGEELFSQQDFTGWLNTMSLEFGAAQKLRSRLLYHPVVITADSSVKELIAGFDLSQLEDPDRTGMDLLWGSISPREYVANLAMVSVLIAPFRIPFELQQLLQEARECFALGHHAATQSLSRTILEAAVNDVAVRIGSISRRKIEQNGLSMRKRIELIAPTHSREIYEHYENLCKVVHAVSMWSADGPLGSLTKTIGYVQHLYEINEIQVQQMKVAKM